MIGEFGEALVMDWGLARAMSDDETPGIVVGTAGYMSPEQSGGEPVTERSDIYALGALLRFMAKADPPKALASIARKAMAAAPSERYATAMLLSDDVGRWLEGHAVGAHRETWVESTARFVGRHRVLLSLLGVYLVVRVILALVAR